ncbi:chaperonin 10-like protein [Fusarium avenaceum]|nr:chaperonin 10-like protein [Fusarium avenaceum]
MASTDNATTTAIAVIQQQSDLVSTDVEVPQLQAHQVYVKVEYAAFNPTDRLAFDLHAFGDGAVLGCDFVGTVTRTHPNVTKLEVGDKIAALVWGGEIKGLGAYSTLCIADERIAFKIPETVGHPEACTIPLAINTAYLALFSETALGLPRNNSESGTPLLIWGGSSIVGYFAIQLAKMHGYAVATTCSPRNFEYVREAGATHVFDYRDPEVASKIRTELPTLAYVFDTIGSVDSSSTAASALNESKGALCTVRPGRANTQDVSKTVKISDVFVFTAFPTPHSYRGTAHWPVMLENHHLSAELYNELPGLLSDGLIKPPRVRTLGKLCPAVILEAMELNRSGKVSAEKLCFEVSE